MEFARPINQLRNLAITDKSKVRAEKGKAEAEGRATRKA